MVGLGTIGIVGMVVALLVYLLVRRSGSPSRDRQNRKKDDVAHPSEYFERKHATITFPDGSDEDVVYDEREDKEDGRTFLKTYSPDCWEVGRKWTSGCPYLDSQGVPDEDTRMFSLSNVRDINVNRTDSMVAGVSVDITRHQERYGDDGNWYTDSISFDKHEDYEVGLWFDSEWQAHIEDE